MANVSINISELLDLRLEYAQAADHVEGGLVDQFHNWVDEVYEIMREEVPVDTGELRDSIKVERRGPLRAKVHPTKEVSSKRRTNYNLGFMLNYGTAKMAPNDFMDRTRMRAIEVAPQVDLTGALYGPDPFEFMG